MATSYVLKWFHGREIEYSGGTGRGPEYRWTLMSILDDGRLFGEIEKLYDRRTLDSSRQAGKHATAQAELSAEDTSKFMAIAERVMCWEQEGVGEGWTGLLAKGSWQDNDKPVIRYCPGDEGHSKEAAMFLELIEILKPYMAPFYSHVDE